MLQNIFYYRLIYNKPELISTFTVPCNLLALSVGDGKSEKKKLLTFVIEVINVRRTGNLGNEPRGAMGPANKTIPVRRTRFIYSV